MKGRDIMAIYDILCGIKDNRAKSNECIFNGYLEDFLGLYEDDEELVEECRIFKELLEIDDSIRICTSLRLNINKDAIANQIIRYKDSFKLPKGQIRCPYVLYGKFDDVQRAIVLKVGKDEDYILAKALYYVMSEPENEFEGTRNEIISMNFDLSQPELLVKTINRFFIEKEKAGIIQRSLDHNVFDKYDEMYELAQKIANYQLVNLKDILCASDDREETINNIIAIWFLLKKFSYVQYMMDKNNLNRIHEGNVKKQRQVAKEKCDAISFVSYSELWKLAKTL